MLLYKIINDMSAEKSKERHKSKYKVIRGLKDIDKEYNRIILLKERQSKSRSRTFK